MQGMEEMKLAQVKKVQLCGFLSRVLNGKRLDLKFENDEQVMPLMSALSLWESFSDSVADQALYESIKRLLFIQSAGVCLERGNYDMALEVLDKMVEKYQMPEELQMKLSAIVKRKDLYHQCFIQFSFTRLVETIKTFLDAVLKAHPSDFLLKAASKVALMCREAGVEGDTEDLDSSGPATQCGEDLKNGEDQQEAQTMAIDEKRWTFKHKKSLLPKHASPWKPESGKKQCGGFQRCSRRGVLTDKLSTLPNEDPDLPKNTKNGGMKKMARRKWTAEEDHLLKAGVRRYGEGRWSQILLEFDFHDRTGVMLKDRWRTLKKLGIVG
ncbi:hypothetical protein GJAV_G00078670 [Gymnothorax javanicus]|nr:hypothetical protein GJAV_G00078670 [Gymnothorax javanicus]